MMPTPALGCLLVGWLLSAQLACQDAAASPSEALASQVAPVPAECGAMGQPDCPTQRWMKATLQTHLRTHDFRRLEESLNRLAERAPDGFSNWAEMAVRGAQAAARADEPGVRRACQDCHERHRETFRQTRRGLELM
jgi:hypothetical protein